MKKTAKSKAKEIKKFGRDAELEEIRRTGASGKLPGNRIFKDKKKHDNKYGARKPISDDE